MHDFLNTGRILILDGGFGTMLQRKGCRTEDSELLNLENPSLVGSIHDEYIEAGADIVTTNSFGASSIGQAAYGMADRAPEMALRAAQIARAAADRASRKVLVAGSIGPTGQSLSIASDADDPALRATDFLRMKDAFRDQAASLVEGGVDLLLLETSFDALNTKAAILALTELGNPLPVIISATVSDMSGRTLTGQTLEAFYTSVKHCPSLAAFGINCALGIRQMAPLAREIASFSEFPLIFYPNAGLPDEMGAYSDSPELMASEMAALADEGLLRIAGGCCGTGPEHISAIAAALKGKAPGKTRPAQRVLTVSGLEAIKIEKSLNFINIGERTNVAGSKKFARLMASDSYSESLDVARSQIMGGASVIDINTDDPMVDSAEKMRVFLRYAASDPAVAKAPLMIDSSHWGTILEGLRNAQGKCIVNSISLKDGQEEFLRKALTIRSYGAAMVVMAFDEQGQAETFERKIEICRRSYDLLTGAGIPPEEIIFDCNILSVGTGIPEHSRFGVDFIEAVRWIKTNLPGSLTSGGVSNLSFSFRGNNPVREAMHSVFLYHAIRAGLDMAIVNPGSLRIYDDLEKKLRDAVEDVILDRDSEATARLVEIAPEYNAAQGAAIQRPGEPGQELTDPAERLSRAMVQGFSASLAEDAMSCMEKLGSALAVVEGPLMAGMEKVGELFSQGKMFLPQVVKSARMMKEAVDVLQPHMTAGEEGGGRPRFLIATVKGDVHDIGKNITATVLQCSGFEVMDLGVMVPTEEILEKAAQWGADIIGVSGLITPSLVRMEELCAEMSRRRMHTPLFVGGAAASATHTAVKLSPLYDDVHYCANASETAVQAKKCLESPESFLQSEKAAHEKLRTLHESARRRPVCSCCSRAAAPAEAYATGITLDDIPLKDIRAEELLPEMDWELFHAVCRSVRDAAARRNLEKEALDWIAGCPGIGVRLCARFFEARREGDCMAAADGQGPRFEMLRDSHSFYCLADCLPEKDKAPLGIFAIRILNEGKSPEGDGGLVGFAARAALVETASKWLQKRISASLGEGLDLIAPGVGYACCPDHSLKRDILALLPSEMGIKLTSSCAMQPEESVCGFLLACRNARYGEVREVSRDALLAYASRRGLSEEDVRLFLSQF